MAASVYCACHGRQTYAIARCRQCQLTLPACDHEPSRLLLQRKAAAPLKPDKPQQPCDVGLFSDQAAQSDLVAHLAKQTTP